MALNKAILMTGILKVLNDAQKKKTTPAGNAALAKGIADEIDKYVKAGVVTTVVAPGIAVTTAGSPSAQVGATVSPGAGTGAIL